MIKTKKEILGQGSYGKVYKRPYVDMSGKEILAAYKKIKKGGEENLSKEIETLKKLNHLFVIKYIDVVEENAKKYVNSNDSLYISLMYKVLIL